MSAPIRIDPQAASRAKAPADCVARPIADEAALTWLCPVCGQVRAYEGGRPTGLGHENDCRECGGRLAASPEEWTAIARHEAGRPSVRMLIDSNLF